MSKTALIAGGAGFIGSHLADHLVSLNYSVSVIDNLCTGSQENIDFIEKLGVNFIAGDICKVDHLPSSQRFDEIYNLASPASPIDFDSLALEILKKSIVFCKPVCRLTDGSQFNRSFALLMSGLRTRGSSLGNGR